MGTKGESCLGERNSAQNLKLLSSPQSGNIGPSVLMGFCFITETCEFVSNVAGISSTYPKMSLVAYIFIELSVWTYRINGQLYAFIRRCIARGKQSILDHVK